MVYEDVHAWYKVVGLIQNRVHVINMTVGSDVCKLHYSGGSYYIELCECDFASYKVYDMASVSDAFERVDAAADAVWYMSRAGMFTKNQRTMTDSPLCNVRLSTFL